MLRKLALAAALVAACNAYAQSGKTTRIVVGFPPGRPPTSSRACSPNALVR